MKKLFIVSLFVVWMFILAACGGGDTAPADTGSAETQPEETAAETAAEPAVEEAAAEPESITLKMTAWDIATTPYWQAVVDAYEAQNPNVHVELVEISSQEY